MKEGYKSGSPASSNTAAPAQAVRDSGLFLSCICLPPCVATVLFTDLLDQLLESFFFFPQTHDIFIKQKVSSLH